MNLIFFNNLFVVVQVPTRIIVKSNLTLIISEVQLLSIVALVVFLFLKYVVIISQKIYFYRKKLINSKFNHCFNIQSTINTLVKQILKLPFYRQHVHHYKAMAAEYSRQEKRLYKAPGHLSTECTVPLNLDTLF